MLIQANALYMPLASNSVHCVVTSIPYWGLRSYDLEPVIWDGVEGCEHEWSHSVVRAEVTESTRWQHTEGGGTRADGTFRNRHANAGQNTNDARMFKPVSTDSCVRCSAWRGDLGLEPTVESYVKHVALVSLEIKRVLRPDGVFWLNLADCHYSGDRGGYRLDSHRWEKSPMQAARADRGGSGIPLAPNRLRQEGLQDGDLVGVPWRVAFALRAEGWKIRQVLHWWKENPMPESPAGWRWEQHRIKVGRGPVDWTAMPEGWDSGEGSHDNSPKGNYRKQGEREATIPQYADCPGCKKCLPNDGLILRRGSWRHTSAVEYIFMLTKGDRYWADGVAAREPSTGRASGNTERKLGDDYGRPGAHRGASTPYTPDGTGRNPRNFTLLPTEPYPGAHYATFPTWLVLPLISATCPKNCCAKCGRGWSPVVERTDAVRSDFKGSRMDLGKTFSRDNAHRTQLGPRFETVLAGDERLGDYRGKSSSLDPQSAARRILGSVREARLAGGDHDNPFVPVRIKGRRPSCSCGGSEAIPGVALDPFCGSGTVGEVCGDLGVRFIGLDLSFPYLRDQAMPRVEWKVPELKTEDLPLFAQKGGERP